VLFQVEPLFDLKKSIIEGYSEIVTLGCHLQSVITLPIDDFIHMTVYTFILVSVLVRSLFSHELS